MWSVRGWLLLLRSWQRGYIMPASAVLKIKIIFSETSLSKYKGRVSTTTQKKGLSHSFHWGEDTVVVRILVPDLTLITHYFMESILLIS